MQKAFEVETVLGKLMGYMSDAELQRKAHQISLARDIPEDAVGAYLRDLHMLSLPVSREPQVFCARMAKLIKQVRTLCNPFWFLVSCARHISTLRYVRTAASVPVR